MTTRKRRTKTEILQALQEKREALEFEIACERSPHVRSLAALYRLLDTLRQSAPTQEEAQRFEGLMHEANELLSQSVTVALAAPDEQ